MAVIKTTNSDGHKTICFKYPIQTLFDDVSLDTLTMADKMEKGQDMAAVDRIDEYAITEDEKYQFDNFLKEGHVKVFSRLLKMTFGLANSIALNFAPLLTGAPVAKQVRLNMTGTMGSLTINYGPVGESRIIILDTLTNAIGFWALSHLDDYSAQGILLQPGADFVTFTAQVPGVDFVNPTITATTGDMTGTLEQITGNVEPGIDPPHVSVTIRDKEGYNNNYVDIIDNEVFLALKHYILKEWYVKCLLGDPSKYYEMKFVDNMKAIQKYGLMLRKPMRIYTAPPTA